ncbi:resolvase, N-terminal domain protein [[Bacteroides] pectinophilus ATCC 43243]|uniref:Resolvase/invertase-type recombinase catalytic domain-containing protein n=1 Tax=[Bacteroides] pectinophilus ATCC 43243 TaxID=483218 RepID=B7ARE9_9FIRM|nr:resolvase, N-terminal domain protein [[Bacteroides] pectinophilus ATCC 43243]
MEIFHECIEKRKTKCYIYTRVSTAIQVDGYSLDAQKDKLREYAEFQDMEIVGEYSDEGHSGKNIKGHQEFMRMLNDIEDGIDSPKENGKLLYLSLLQ